MTLNRPALRYALRSLTGWFLLIFAITEAVFTIAYPDSWSRLGIVAIVFGGAIALLLFATRYNSAVDAQDRAVRDAALDALRTDTDESIRLADEAATAWRATWEAHVAERLKQTRDDG